MGDNMNKQIEKFESDYDKIFAKGAWTKEDLEMMKDLQKLMYYLEVRCAMKKAEEEGEYMDQQSYASGRSYANNSYAHRGQMRNPSNGRFMDSGRGSGTYPMDGGWYYDGRGGNASGRRYYDGEKENAVNELHRMMNNMSDPESKMALQDAIRNLEMK